ncbi:HAD family hydrolase [Mediterraneibacter glycyrrhizinilyticus]|uniref:HAD family hydrolase n=1 Tax=Mediterraneibacter glycyrrhizinilyticus TaxID=342942 RepID=UPI0019620157|nr:HAD family hydrolase [Mediterraneibacter glycyrrhizinilyticus]MBM6751747.1 HAD family hydrolase [Mediterraneibacter glycyrrhizinilyticus]
MSEKTRKTAVLFDVDDTLYDQTVPFKEAYSEYFGAGAAVPADVIYPVTRKYSDRVYSRAMAGEITMEEMYIYRVQKAFGEFDISITDKEALDFQKIYAGRQRHIHMSPLMERILSFCSEKAELGIITNGPSAHQWNKVKSLRAERWVPHENIFVSADVGAEKPERKIFDCAKRGMGLEDTEVWFVGDAYPLDVVGALNAGWNAVWMNRRRREKPEDAGKTGPGRVACVETEEELDGFIRELLE